MVARYCEWAERVREALAILAKQSKDERERR